MGESSGCGIGLPSILIVRVGLCLTALCSASFFCFLPLLGRPLCWPPSFLRWLSTLALPTQCFCFSALCSGPLRSLSLSLCSPTLCALMVVVCVDGRVGWSHTFTHFIFVIYFISMRYQTSFNICTPSSKRLYSSLASPPTFFHRPHHFPSFLVERFCSFLCMHAHFFVIFISSFSLSPHFERHCFSHISIVSVLVSSSSIL